MNKKKRTIVWIVILIIILTGAGGAGSIYYYFFAKQFQLTKTTYIYIDRDDNLDSCLLYTSDAADDVSWV